MEKFVKYQHLERLGQRSVEGILEGMCYIFPKLDGTNATIWWDFVNQRIRFGSRNKELFIGKDSDNFGFAAQFEKDERFLNFFKENPHAVLRGEFLVPHTIKDYQDAAWREFYVFDVQFWDAKEGDYRYVPYESYLDKMLEYDILCIPVITKLENPEVEELMEIAENNSFLMKDGKAGEGIVIKNYNFVNRGGIVKWAKVVLSRFKEDHKKEFGENKQKDSMEQKFVNKFVDEQLCLKEYHKFEDFESKDIPRLLQEVYTSLLVDHLSDYALKTKSLKLNFSMVRHYCNGNVKTHFPDMF